MVSWQGGAPPLFREAKWETPMQAGYLERAKREGNTAALKVLAEYAGGQSLWLNNYLRGLHMGALPRDAKRRLEEEAQRLGKLIKDAPRSTRNVVVFRAISEGAPSRQFQNYRRGDDADFLSRGIVSTSVNAENAWQFLEEGDRCCFLVLLLPKHTAMLEVLEASLFDYEKEVLLPHGSKFKIMSSTVIDGITVFYCALVGQIQG